MQLRFTAPEELAGMELTLEGDTASLRYQGMQHSQPLGTVPQASFAACLSQALLQLAQPGQEGFTRTARGWVWKGKVNGLRCGVQIAQDGSLRRLEVPAVGLRIDITYQAPELSLNIVPYTRPRRRRPAPACPRR